MKKPSYIDMTIDDFWDSFDGRVGCVYPSDGDSYFIGSNIQEKLYYVNLVDGGLFATKSMEELSHEGYPLIYKEVNYGAV